MLAIELALTLKKVVLPYAATALARRVFPVPGGPNIKTPFHGLLIPVKNFGIKIGRSTASLRHFLQSLRPAISSNVTLGLLSITSYSSISIRATSGPTPSGYMCCRNVSAFFPSSA